MKTPGKKRLRLDSVWRNARDLILERRGRLLFGLGLILINRLAGLVLPAALKFLIDDVIGEGKTELLGQLALAAGLATVVQAVSSFSLTQLLSIAAQRSIAEMRKQVQQHVSRLPIAFFDSTKTGELISRIMTDAEGIRNLVGTGLVQLIGGIITAVIALGVLFYLNWHMTLITLVVMLVFGGMMAVTFGKLRPMFRQRNEVYAQVTGRLTESLGGIRVVKAYTAERREDLVFAQGAHKLLRLVARTITATSSVTAGTTLLFGGIGVLMMLLGGRAILNDQMTLGDLITYVFFTGMVAAPMVQISAVGTQITEAFAGLDRIRELLARDTEEEDDLRRQPITGIRGDVELEGVSFEYNAGIPVLSDVSFKAPAGTTTALVGSSGSGKSTLISLIMAFNRPQKGRVLIDGQDLTTLRLLDFRSHLGIVLQDNFLFDGTVAYNIAYSTPNASRAAIEEAGRLAHCDVFVEQFPDGYDTLVGERGVKVSGGQRQRIAIARAILADPSLLILDEATSSLDSESEALIQDGLRRLRQGRTTFVIAHRLSTIQSADQILVIENGEIVEHGDHESLLAAEGRYRELYDKQYRFERERFINPGEDFTPEPEPLPTLEAPDDNSIL